MNRSARVVSLPSAAPLALLALILSVFGVGALTLAPKAHGAENSQYATIVWHASVKGSGPHQASFPQTIVDHVLTVDPSLSALDGDLTGTCTAFQVDVYRYSTQTERQQVDALISGGVLLSPNHPAEPLVSGGEGHAWKFYYNSECAPPTETTPPVTTTTTPPPTETVTPPPTVITETPPPTTIPTTPPTETTTTEPPTTTQPPTTTEPPTTTTTSATVPPTVPPSTTTSATVPPSATKTSSPPVKVTPALRTLPSQQPNVRIKALPYTGINAWQTGGLAALLLGVGITLVLATRKTRRH
jgi:hypothetical protein